MGVYGGMHTTHPFEGGSEGKKATGSGSGKNVSVMMEKMRMKRESSKS